MSEPTETACESISEVGIAPKIMEHDPAVSRMIGCIPRHIWQSFTDDQRAAIAQAMRRYSGNHLLSLRSSVRMIGNRYYLALFFGRERRDLDRLQNEGQLDPTEVSIAYVIVGIFFLLASIVPIALGIYMIKSLLGIDILDGPSPLHYLLWG